MVAHSRSSNQLACDEPSPSSYTKGKDWTCESDNTIHKLNIRKMLNSFDKLSQRYHFFCTTTSMLIMCDSLAPCEQLKLVSLTH